MIRSLLFGKAQSRWLILMIDLLVVSWAFALSFLIVNKFWNQQELRWEYLAVLLGYCATTMFVFILMKIHTGIIRYSNTVDITRVFSAMLLCSVSYGIIIRGIYWQHVWLEKLHLIEVMFLSFFISSVLLILFRLTVKTVFNLYKEHDGLQRIPVLIYGSGRSSVLIKQAFEAHPETKFCVVGFLDDDPDKTGKYIEQKKVFCSVSFGDLKRKHANLELILSKDSLSSSLKNNLLKKCIDAGIRVLTVPPASHWLNGRLSLNQMADLKIEDLLQRPPIVLNTEGIHKQLFGKRILITGAAGSIGSEIVRQVLGYNPEYVILCDQAESPLHDLQLELEDKLIGEKAKVCIANVQNAKTMRSIFSAYHPDIVFHAAAYKHVPMMENNPREAILGNVLGTKTMADISVEFGVKRFVMISTDKAVNPTNIMGATKRLAEMYIQSLNSKCHVPEGLLDSIVLNGASPKTSETLFITTRFGNVLGSNGSVIPRFKTQIERCGPVTVTHPDITRYFMTIKESVQLVLEASAMGKGGEIFVFDMGDPVKITDLAKNMIKLSGFEPGKDIDILFTGLRPGEKLYEELLNDNETTRPTHNEKIKISNVNVSSHHVIQQHINELLRLNESADEYSVVKKMKKIVPEYKSNNSRFSSLDLVFETSQWQ
jgi:FlaA1/EpsC-like NDP-sugar epimerase